MFIKFKTETNPLFFRGTPAKTGTIRLFLKAIFKPLIISSVVSSPSSINLINKSSSPSAAEPAKIPKAF